jgi:hypothetical protein
MMWITNMFYCHWEGQPQPGLERERDRGKKGGIEKQGSLHLKNYICIFYFILLR